MFMKVFCSLLNFEKFSTVKLPKKLQKFYIQGFQVKGHQRAPVADQGGPPPSQKARWRGPAPGRATHPPGWAPCPLMASLFSLSLFLPKNMSSSSGSCFFVVLEPVPSISPSSHLFELIFGTSAPWYVTPSPLQLVFQLVASLVSI